MMKNSVLVLYHLVLYDVSSKRKYTFHQTNNKNSNVYPQLYNGFGINPSHLSGRGNFLSSLAVNVFFYLNNLSSDGINASRSCWDGGHRPPRRTEQFHRGRQRKHGPRFRLQSPWCMLWSRARSSWLVVYSLSHMLHNITEIITLFRGWILFHFNAGLSLS